MTEVDTTLSIDDIQLLGHVVDAIADAEQRDREKQNPPPVTRGDRGARS
jgi:hypothetical protein